MVSTGEIDARLKNIQALEGLSRAEVLLVWARINTEAYRQEHPSHWSDVRFEVTNRGLLGVRPALLLIGEQEVGLVPEQIGLQNYCYPMD